MKFACITRVCQDARTLFGKSKHNAINAEKQSTRMRNIGQTQGDTYTAQKNALSEQTKSKKLNHVMNATDNKIIKTVNIQINTIDKVKNFVDIASSIESDLDIISGRYVIDAKSIMGIFSIDLTNPLTLKIYAKNEKSVDNTVKKLKNFII